MRTIVRVIQIIVGVLFIVSGLVKANDPLGLGYKMEEFFQLWNSELSAGNFFLKNFLISTFTYFEKHTLFLSVVMITLEIVAGVALLIGWKKKFILYLLLLLILFFTFLTGYAYLSGKFTNCGCFGDCLPITPFTSFLKDIALLVLILILLFGQKYITPLFSSRARNAVLISSLVVSVLLQWYVLTYLPLVDCLPFKKGNNIAEKMKAPPGSVPDSIAIRFIYEKNGKRFEFAPESLPSDFTTYKYIDRIDKVVRKGNADPPIKGFSLTGASSLDSTQVILQQPLAIVLFCLNFKETGWADDFKKIVEVAKQKNIPVYVASSSLAEGEKTLSQKGITGPQFFNTDFTIVRTVARTNPTLLILKTGTIVKKYSRKGLSNAENDISAGRF